MFFGKGTLKLLDLSYLKEPLEFTNMFQGCVSLEKLHIPFVADYCEDFSNMFNGCSRLKEIDLSTFDTKLAKNMSGMFSNCSRLEKIIQSLNTKNVLDMNNMFFHCCSLETIDLINFNTSNVKNMKSMFEGCSSLEKLRVKFDTKNVENMSRMFYGCSLMSYVDLSSFKPLRLKFVKDMFKDCISLERVKCLYDLYDKIANELNGKWHYDQLLETAIKDE